MSFLSLRIVSSHIPGNTEYLAKKTMYLCVFLNIASEWTEGHSTDETTERETISFRNPSFGMGLRISSGTWLRTCIISTLYLLLLWSILLLWEYEMSPGAPVLNVWSSGVGAILGSHGNSRKRPLAGRSRSLGQGLQVCVSRPRPVMFSRSLSCMRWRTAPLPQAPDTMIICNESGNSRYKP